MTDWPDDWFREGAGGAGRDSPGQLRTAHGRRLEPGGGDLAAQAVPEPTISPSQAPPAPLAGRPGAASRTRRDPGTRRTRTRTRARARRPGWLARPASHPHGAPSRRRPGGPAGRPGGPGGPGGPGRPAMPARTGWRRWLRPRPIALALVVIVSLALIGTVAMYFYLTRTWSRRTSWSTTRAGRPRATAPTGSSPDPTAGRA